MSTTFTVLEMATGASAGITGYLADPEAARFLSLSPGWLRQLRLSGGGPRYSKLGRAVRYRVADLIEWAEAHTISCTSEKKA